MSPDEKRVPVRFSGRALFAGAISTFALMTLFLMLAGGLGLWNFDFLEVYLMGPAFWTFASVAWLLSLYAGSFVSSSLEQSLTEREGGVHGFLVWSVVVVLGYFMVSYMEGNIFYALSQSVASPILLGMFICNLVAMGISIMGGMNGATHVPKVRSQTREDAKLKHAYHNT